MKSLKAESMTGYNFNKFVFIYLLINQSLSRRLSMEKHCRQLFGVAVALRIQEREKTKELVREREINYVVPEHTDIIQRGGCAAYHTPR